MSSIYFIQDGKVHSEDEKMHERFLFWVRWVIGANHRPEIRDCNCGFDHQRMPMIDVGGKLVEGVCTKHNRHIPCRHCD